MVVTPGVTADGRPPRHPTVVTLGVTVIAGDKKRGARWSGPA